MRSTQQMSCTASGPIQAARLQALLVLLRDLAAGGQEEHLLVHLPHRPAHRVRETTREVDEATLEVPVETAQVEDDRLIGLESVAELLRVVEAVRLHDVHR